MTLKQEFEEVGREPKFKKNPELREQAIKARDRTVKEFKFISEEPKL